MSVPREHIDNIRAELEQMVTDGHLNEYEASTRAGAVEYELSRLEEALKD